MLTGCRESVRDDRPVTPIVVPCYDLEAPITCEEVKIALRGLKDAAPGLDGMKRKNLDGMKFIDCAVHMTLWLFAGLPPSPFKEVVTCIPKGTDTSAPSEFRPITVDPCCNSQLVD